MVKNIIKSQIIMLELTKSLCADAAKLVFAGVVVTELLRPQEDLPSKQLILGAVVVVVFVATAYFVQYIINKKSKSK